MPTNHFTELGECERCRRDRLLCPTGVCQSCLDEMIAIRSDQRLRSHRLREIDHSEKGVIRSVCGQGFFETHQGPPRLRINLETIMNERDRQKAIDLAIAERAQAIITASGEQLAAARSDSGLTLRLTEVNDELIRWLAKHPEQMRELAPRKFEEVVAQILRDQGHSVTLTPATRDGGRDLVVLMRTPLGEMLVIVECKRWLPPNKVGLAVVERFLHVLREKTRANYGIIATTTHFSADAIKSAQEYKYLLQLADFDRLQEMAMQYGQWHLTSTANIWVPNYTDLTLRCD